MQPILSAKENLPRTLKLTKLPMDNPLNFEVDHQNEWLAELLGELALKTLTPDEEDNSAPHPDSHIKLQLEITRHHNSTYREYVVITGELDVHYHSYCVRCLEPLELEFVHPFATCYIPQEFENTPEYEEATHIYTEEQELELYFHQKGLIDLKELIHEHLFLMVDEFPLHAEDCKGLCQQCGANLNLTNCGH